MDLDEHDRAGGEAAGAIRGFGFGADSLFQGQELTTPAQRLCACDDWMLHVKTPVGEPCHLCQVPISVLDVGYTMIRVGETATRVAVHRQCFLRSILPDSTARDFWSGAS